MKKKMFMLGASALQAPAIRRAKEKGLYVYALDYDPQAEAIPFADEFLCISTIDREAVYEAALRCRPDYIVTSTSDMPVRTVAWVCERLGMSCDLSFEDAVCATDKAAMRRRMRDAGVPIPEFHEVHSAAELKEKAVRMGGRFVVKPVDNAASRGVVLAEAGARTDYGRLYEFAHRYSRSGAVLIEAYMEGEEVSVEAFTVNGAPHIVAVTDKLVSGGGFFVETGHTEPSRHTEKLQKDIRRVAEAAIRALHMRSGPSHTEIKLTEEGPKLVEIAARLGGDRITSHLVPLSTGIDLIDASICATMGEPVNLTGKAARGAAIRFLSTARGVDGRGSAVARIEGLAEAAAMTGVQEAQVYCKPGDTVGALQSSNDRLGHVIATGADASEAEQNCEAARDRIRIVTA